MTFGIKVKMRSIGAAAIFTLAGSAFAAGIPVIDAAHIATAKMNSAEQIAKWVVQLQDMKTQIDKMQGVWSTLKDGRGMANILKEDLAKQFLPKDYWAVAEAIRNNRGDWSGISGKVADLIKANQLKSCAELNKDPILRQQCEAQWRNVALQKELGDLGYKKAAENIENLQKFVKSINESADQKVISEIQARIQVEQVRMQNEQMKLATIQKMEEAERMLVANRTTNHFQTGLRNFDRPSF